jgi:hypothetical protein
MKAKVISDAHVLIPNKNHQNFTRTGEIIPAGTKVEGTVKVINGLKRGLPFDYKLFYTNDKKIIYIKNIKPMEKTEVTLGADAAQSATVVGLPNTSNLGTRPIIGVVVGATAGFLIARKRKVATHSKVIYTVIGGLVGFVAGKYLQSKRKVVVKASK